jgi:ABC-type glycerol-3-phosphate transport system substrate-binding protein
MPDTYENFLDLSTINFSWWDRLVHDPLNKVPELYGYGPRCINITAGFVFTWQFHKDLMAEAGLDPRNDVKTWDDLKGFIAAGTEWVNSNPDVDFFWDQAWHAWVFGSNYMRTIPLAFPDGQQDDQMACWKGEKAFNDAASPFRHPLEFFKEANDEGWIPENCWTREWETDMEASYIAKKSVMMLHGPWPWDKMLASDPTAEQEGLPASPPAEGQDTWMQFQSEPRYAAGQASMLARVVDTPEWPEIEKMFDWYHSPPMIKARLEILGQAGLYELDEPLDLIGPQWLGVVKDIDTPGGVFEDVKITRELWGEQWIDPKRIGGSPGTWDWDSGAMVEPFADVLKGDMSVQEFLDWAQKNWEASYEL